MDIELSTFYDDTPATIDWNPLGEVYYRKVEIYDMAWVNRFDLSKYIIVGCNFGGPIAITKEDSTSVSSNTKSTINIFSASGIEQATIKWDGGKLIKMGWSNKEDLLCVSEDGVMYIYDMFGEYKKESSFFVEPQRALILEVEIFTSNYGTGICLLTSEYQFFVAQNIYDIKLNRLQSPFALESPPSSWAVLNLPDKQSTVLMAIDSALYELDTFQHKSKNPLISHPVTSFIKISVSFNQKYVAMFADTGLLWIGSSDLSGVYCQYNSHLQICPLQLVWCGSGAVVGHWDNYLLVVGPKQDTLKYFVDTNVHLVQELDGVRLVGNKITEFLQKVPEEVEDIHKLGSVKPGAMLLDASKEYEKKTVRVDEYMKTIKDHLLEAVQECIKAAGYEFEPKKQRRLIKAALFGKRFLQDMRPQAFVDMCQTIRVLNNIRDFKIGIPITYDQLQRLTTPVLIDRLIARRLYLLAIKICDYLHVPKREGASRILAHWACYKVLQDNNADELVAKSIAEKLGDTPGISYTEIALKAFEKGRTALAMKLLDYEAKAADQVPLLMKMKSNEQALQKAVQSGDTDLVNMVTEDMRKSMTTGEFLMKIRTFPLALSLFIKYCKNEEHRLLIDIYYQEDMFSCSGNVFVQDSFAEKMLDSRIKMLWKAKESFDKGCVLFSSQVTDENIKLLEFQSKLQVQLGKQFLNLSVTDTLYQLLYQGINKQAEQLRKDFLIPESRYWWTKIQALSANRDWVELEKFSKSKKSPIGYEPFAEVCIKYGNNLVEAEKYIMKVPLEKKVKLYLKLGSLEHAAEAAFQTKSLDNLNLVSLKCTNNRKIAEKIMVYRSQLSQKQ